MNKNIFLSVGNNVNSEQEKFIAALEKRLSVAGLTPHTLGRNSFTSEAPLRKIEQLMSTCEGTIVLALERTLISSGIEKRGSPKEQSIYDVRLATPWNQIEAAMSYAYDKPLLVIAEDGVKLEGLLEPGYDWFVQTLPLAEESLNTAQFIGVLADWKEKISSAKPNGKIAPLSPSDVSMWELLKSLNIKHVVAAFTVCIAMLGASYKLGVELAPLHKAGSSAPQQTEQSAPIRP